MAYLGHFPDEGPPDASWTDEPEESSADSEAGPDDNVRTLDFSRSWGDPDAP
jgi:histidinol-phosphatase